MVAILGAAFVVSNADSLIGDDQDQFTSSVLNLQDPNSIGVAGISYNCHSSYTTDGEPTTPSVKNMLIDYSLESEVECTITPLMPQDYIYMTLMDESMLPK